MNKIITSEIKESGKTYNDFEIYIKSVIDKYQPILLAQVYEFNVEKIDDYDNSYMACQYCYPYMNPNIQWTSPAYTDWINGKNIEPVILHEMCHAITDPFYTKAFSRYIAKTDLEDERERLTEHICNIILKLENHK